MSNLTYEVTHGIKKRFLGYVKIDTISISASDIEDAVRAFQGNMSTALKRNGTLHFIPKNM